MHKKKFAHGVREAAALSLTIGTCLTAVGAAPGPVPQVPEGGQAPGPYPNTSVSGVNVIARGSTTFNSSVEVTGLAGSGPIPWSVNRYNRGDFALRLSPRDPAAALGNLNQGFIEFGDAAPGIAAHHAWRPDISRGVVIPTARQNGPVNWNDGEGAFFPTVGVAQASSGPGYNMVDGSFGNGNFDLVTGRAGTHASSPEGNFSFSATWFPYDQGWLGGEVAGPDVEGRSRWTGPNNHAAGLAAGSVRWLDFPATTLVFGGRAEVNLPGVNSLTDGMLFATSSDGGSDVNIVGVAPDADGTGWQVAVREDSATDAETLASADQSEFQFVYVPYDAQNLIGGLINGSDAAKVQSRGDFTVTRTAAGTYELAISGKTATSGTLILQAADLEPGTTEPLATRAFLSYEFNATSGRFVIQSRVTTSDTTADLRDSDFYFAWVDFANPLAMPVGPRLRSFGPLALNDETVVAREAGIGVNTHEAEVLVTTIDSNTGAHVDPITGQGAVAALIGHFVNPVTMQRIGEPFVILGNPNGVITRHDVTYNAFSKQYIVVANARTYGANSLGVPLIALVNPSSVAGEASPVAKAFAWDENTDSTYDDVAVAASSKNGNFLLVAERNFAGEGEGAIGVLFNKDGTALTPQFARLDTLQGTGDEDDPDIKYFEGRDVFFYTSNTDVTGGLRNRITGAVVQTTPNGNQLQVGTEQPLTPGSFSGITEGHPASIESPFNGQVLTAFDLGGNGVERGVISYVNVGPAPTYSFTQARAEIPYLDGVAASGDPLRHNHPQFAADPTSGVIALGHNANASLVGNPDAYVVTLLGPDGSPLPSPLGTPYFVADSPGNIGNSANFHNIKYSPASDAFVYVFNTTPGVTYVGALQVTSNHLTAGPRPEMQINVQGDLVFITWPTTSGATLQATDSLSNPNWAPVTALIETVDGNTRARVPASGATRFFRLAP